MKKQISMWLAVGLTLVLLGAGPRANNAAAPDKDTLAGEDHAPKAAKAPRSAATDKLMAEIQDALSNQKYAEAVPKITRALSLKGEAAAGLDRYQLLMERGNCQLQLKTPGPAAESYALAEKEAADVAMARGAHGLSLLARKSTGGGYQSKIKEKGKPAEVLAINDDNSRKAAFAAMYADEQPALKARLETATKSASLPQVIEASRWYWDLASLEWAATDSDEQSKPLAGLLAGRVGELLAPALEKGLAQLDEISAATREQVNINVNNNNGNQNYQVSAGGLNPNQQREVMMIINDCKQLAPKLQELSRNLNGDSEILEKTKKDLETLYGFAQRLAGVDDRARRRGR